MYQVAFSTNGREIWGAADDGVIRAWDVAGGAPLRTVVVFGNNQAQQFDRSGQLMNSTAAAEKEFVHLVERSDRSVELLGDDELREKSSLRLARPRAKNHKPKPTKELH